MNKVVRDGKVAVLYSPVFGAGWFSWNQEYPQLMFHPTLVEMVEQYRQSEITEEFVQRLMPEVKDVYCGGAGTLRIAWLPEGTRFEVSEYDGAESINTFDSLTQTA